MEMNIHGLPTMMPPRRIPSPNMGATEAAKLFHVQVETITLWCREGRLPAIKVGKSWIIQRALVEEMLAMRHWPDGRNYR
jgi:excisionase family DNA binding protein